jgi:hypothetical protein
MADQTVRLKHSAFSPPGLEVISIEIVFTTGNDSVFGIGGKSVIPISISIIFRSTASRMANAAILSKDERGEIYFQEGFVIFPRQLRENRTRASPPASILAGTRAPGIGLFKIFSHLFPFTLEEMIPLRDLFVIVAFAAGLFRAVGDIDIDPGNWIDDVSVFISQENRRTDAHSVLFGFFIYLSDRIK